MIKRWQFDAITSRSIVSRKICAQFRDWSIFVHLPKSMAAERSLPIVSDDYLNRALNAYCVPCRRTPDKWHNPPCVCGWWNLWHSDKFIWLFSLFSRSTNSTYQFLWPPTLYMQHLLCCLSLFSLTFFCRPNLSYDRSTHHKKNHHNYETNNHKYIFNGVETVLYRVVFNFTLWFPNKSARHWSPHFFLKENQFHWISHCNWIVIVWSAALNHNFCNLQFFTQFWDVVSFLAATAFNGMVNN